MSIYYQKTREILNIIYKKLVNFKKAINQISNEAINILSTIDNINADNNFQNLKSRLKNYEDLCLSTFNSNIIIEIKENIKNIFDEIDKINENDIDKYNNYLQNYTSLLLGLNEAEDERKLESSDLYKSLEENWNYQMKNNINEQLYTERTNNSVLYFYGIYFYTRSKIIFDNTNNKDILLNQIMSKLSENKNKIILLNINSKSFIHNYIKSEKFDLIHNNNEFDNYEVIKDIKKFINFIGDKNIDCLGNSLYFNSSFNNRRGKEKYYPPYGWIGIGLKVNGKYIDDNWINIKDETSQWANAYHPVSSLDSIPKITEEGLKPGPSQDKKMKEIKDIKGKKLEKGYIYIKI